MTELDIQTQRVLNKQKINEIVSQLTCGKINTIRGKRKLGEGTEGAVYEWCVSTDDCPYVVKIQKGNMSHWNEMKIEILEEISKTNKYASLDIAPSIYSFKECKNDGVFMMLMDKVNGSTIAYLMMKDTLTLPIFDKIIETVNIVHAQGDYHSDLNPANIFYSNDKITLIDFGVRYKEYKVWYDFIGMLYYLSWYYENSRDPNKLDLYKSFFNKIVKIVKKYDYSQDKCTKIFLRKAKDINKVSSNIEMIDMLRKFRTFAKIYFILGDECNNEKIDEDFDKPFCSDFDDIGERNPGSMLQNVESDSGYLLYGFVYDKNTKSNIMNIIAKTSKIVNELSDNYALTTKITSITDCAHRKVIITTQDFPDGEPLMNYYKTNNKLAFLNVVGALLFIHRLGYTHGNPTTHNTYYDGQFNKTIFTGLYHDSRNSYYDYIKLARSVAADYINGAEIEFDLLKEIFADIFSSYEIEKEQIYGEMELRDVIIKIFDSISNIAKSPGFKTLRQNIDNFLSISKIY